MKLNNNLLLIIGAVLIGYSLFGSNINIRNENADLQLNKPSEVLLKLSQPVIDSIKNQSSESNKDGVILANLYNDIATLIELDDTIIKNTEEIREANKLSGSLAISWRLVLSK